MIDLEKMKYNFFETLVNIVYSDQGNACVKSTIKDFNI